MPTPNEQLPWLKAAAEIRAVKYRKPSIFPKELKDPWIWVGAVAGLAGLFVLCWGSAILCVIAGYGPEVCGL